MCVFVRQTSTLALLSTSDRAITLAAKRWTPPVIGQLIVRLDICTRLDTLVNTTAPSADSYCPIHNHCWVLLRVREQHKVFLISSGKKKNNILYRATDILVLRFPKKLLN